MCFPLRIFTADEANCEWIQTRKAAQVRAKLMETDHAVGFLLRPLLAELAARLFSVSLAFLRCTRYSFLFLL